MPHDATCYAVAVNPNDDKHILVGGLFNGIYESRDGGRSAVRLAASAPDSSVHAVGFDDSGKRLVVGTAADGVFEVRNGKWTSLGLPNANVRRIV